MDSKHPNRMPYLASRVAVHEHRTDSAAMAAEGDGTTQLAVRSMFWGPTKTPGDPGWQAGIHEAIQQAKPHVPVEGYKVEATERLAITGSEPCVMCWSGKPFKSCCRAKHRRAVQVFQQKNPTSILYYSYDPVPYDTVHREMGPLAMAGARQGKPFSAKKWLKVSLLQVAEVSFTVSEALGALCKARLNEDNAFHARTHNMWDCIGWMALTYPTGILTFGNVQMEPAGSGRVRVYATALTLERLRFLTDCIRNACGDPVEAPRDPCICLTSVRRGCKSLVDQAKLEEAKSLMADIGPVKVERDDESMKRVYYTCTYCGKTQPKLNTCSGCKKASSLTFRLLAPTPLVHFNPAYPAPPAFDAAGIRYSWPAAGFSHSPTSSACVQLGLLLRPRLPEEPLEVPQGRLQEGAGGQSGGRREKVARPP